MTPKYHIPDEVLLNIFSYLTPRPGFEYWPDYTSASISTLACACRASRNVRRVVEPLLYRFIDRPTGEFLEGALYSSRGRQLGAYVQTIEFDRYQLEPREVKWLYRERVRGILTERYGTAGSDLIKLLDDMFGGPDGTEEDGEREDDPAANYLWECGNTSRMTLILCLTPNVTQFHVHAETLMVTDTLSRLLNFCRCRSTIPDGPLSKLTSLHMYVNTPTGDPRSITDANIAALAFFPRLQKFTCDFVDWDNEEGLREPGGVDNDDNDDDEDDDDEEDAVNLIADPDAEDNRVTLPRVGSRPAMKHFGLLDSNPASFADLRDMLRLFPNLEALRLIHSVFEDREEIDLAEYGNVLREFGRDLRWFELEPSAGDTDDFTEDCDEGVIGSLRAEMAALEQLRLPLTALIGTDHDEGDELDLCALLPPSLWWLWTAVTQTGDAGAHFAALARMLGDKRGADGGLPQLEWVFVRLPKGQDHTGREFKSGRFATTRMGSRHVLFTKKTLLEAPMPSGWRESLVRVLGHELDTALFAARRLVG